MEAYFIFSIIFDFTYQNIFHTQKNISEESFSFSKLLIFISIHILLETHARKDL